MAARQDQKKPDDMPQWVWDAAQYYLEQLGLQHKWRIYFKVVDKPDGSVNYDGCSWVNARYFNATIELKRTITDKLLMYEVIVHELLHVCFGRMQNAVMNRLMEQMPQDKQNHAIEIWRDSLEIDNQDLSRQLVAVLPKPPGYSDEQPEQTEQPERSEPVKGAKVYVQ